MSTQHLPPIGSGSWNPNSYLSALPRESTVRAMLEPRRDTWDVEVSVCDTGKVLLHESYLADSSDDAASYAINDALSSLDDPASHFDVRVQLERGARKLWDVLPTGDTPTPDAGPALIGRVVAVDADEALNLAQARYRLGDDDFCVCRV